MTSPNDAGSCSIPPSDGIPVEINGSGVSGHQPSQEPRQAIAQEVSPEAPPEASQEVPQETPQQPLQKPQQGAIASAGKSKTTPKTTPKTTIIVSPASASPSSHQGSHRWLIALLLLTAVAAGLGGAALGWAIRHQARNPHAADPPALLDPFVNNEQSFPPIEGWVGDDPIRQYSPEAFSEEVLPDASPRRAPIRERQFQDSPPVQSRRQIPEEFADPLSPPPVDEPVWTAPDTVPVEPPPQVSQPPVPSSSSSESTPYGALEAPSPAQPPPASEGIRKTKPSPEFVEPVPRQTQSVDIPALPTPASPPFP